VRDANTYGRLAGVNHGKESKLETLEQSPELAEHLAGLSNREIGDARGLSHERARQIVRAQGREIVMRIAGELLVARREGTVLPVATIPDVSGAGFSLGLRWVDWLVGELAALAVFACRVHIEPVPGGYAVGLTEDLTCEEAER
jgi:hypothetical protein